MPRQSVEVVRVDVDVPDGESSHPRGRVVGYADVDIDDEVALTGLPIVFTFGGRTSVEFPAFPALTPAARRHAKKFILRAWLEKLDAELKERLEQYRINHEMLVSPDRYLEYHREYRLVCGADDYGYYGRIPSKAG